MTKLLEWKERIHQIYIGYERIILGVVRFVMALLVFSMINRHVGHMIILDKWYVCFALAVLCGVLPFSATVFLSAAFIVIHLSAISIEATSAVILVFLFMFFLYFRFSPKSEYFIVLTAVACFLKIPQIIPITIGLLATPAALIPTVFGVIIYYFLKGMQKNVAILGDVTTGSDTNSDFVMTINQFFNNKEMYLVLFVLVLTAMIVYFLRRRDMAHAWRKAIVAGVIIEFVILCTGYVMLGTLENVSWLVLGTVLALGGAFVEKLFAQNLDYKRTEHVQFEDDEYYYYVKAVPKISVAVQEQQVKRIEE